MTGSVLRSAVSGPSGPEGKVGLLVLLVDLLVERRPAPGGAAPGGGPACM